MSEDVVTWFNQNSGMILTPVFNQYLRHTAIPKLELKFDEAAGTYSYRWIADEPEFDMPVKVGSSNKWTLIHPTTEWKTDKTNIKKVDFQVATDLYYINVDRQ